MWQDIFYHASILLDQLTAPRGNLLLNARFSRLHEIKQFLTNQFDRTCLSLGESIFGRVLQSIPTQKQRELGHMLLIGRTRGGKGLNIETQLYTWASSCIVNDIKGELYQRTAGYRNSLGRKDAENVFVFHPGGFGHRYDPLANRHTELELRSSATTILHRPNEGENKQYRPA
jgi:type IV secretory pathway TraG/TraD family ATPase VirD4